MINISNSGSSQILITESEIIQATSSPVYYTWKMVRKGTFDEIIFYQDDTSTAPWYWHSFTVSVATSSIGLTQGLVPLYPGEWTYVVYEMGNPYDLDLNNSLGTVSFGLVTVDDTPNTLNRYTQSDNFTINHYR